MGILNLQSDGLPSVLVALVRALRTVGPLDREGLLELACPPTLQVHTAGFERDRHGAKTLLRWTQLGLFHERDGKVSLHADVHGLPRGGYAELAALSGVLRRFVLSAENNVEVDGEHDSPAADFTFALSWALAQDTLALPGGAHSQIGPIETRQFGASSPYPFQNDTRWNGFRHWAPFLGFGWAENSGLVVDPTTAVREELDSVFGQLGELPISGLIFHLSERLPVLDQGMYRRRVESRLSPASWRATADHEISVSLSVSLKRLHESGHIRLEARGDAPKRMLLGRGHRSLEAVSHVLKVN